MEAAVNGQVQENRAVRVCVAVWGWYVLLGVLLPCRLVVGVDVGETGSRGDVETCFGRTLGLGSAGWMMSRSRTDGNTSKRSRFGIDRV